LYKSIKIKIYKPIILPVGLYGHETWSLILRERHRLRMFENKVLRILVRCRRKVVAKGWIKLCNLELDNCTPNKLFLW
jgi:hypothetical protein